MTGGLPVAQTIRYGSDSPQQVLDLYLPDSSAHPAPLVLAIHGGAFMLGNRSWELDALPLLLQRGWAVASLEYRLSGEALFPAAVLDVKAATAHLREHAAEHGLDPAFFAAWGRSAGGHLSAMLGATSGGSEFDAAGHDAAVQAVVDWYGPSDFLQMDQQFTEAPPMGPGPAPQIHDTAESPESKWLGAAIQTVPDRARRANPINHLRGNVTTVPPFFLAAGTNDHLVPFQQTVLLHDALEAAGVSSTLRLLDGALHADPRFEHELTKPTIDWLDNLFFSRGLTSAERQEPQ